MRSSSVPQYCTVGMHLVSPSSFQPMAATRVDSRPKSNKQDIPLSKKATCSASLYPLWAEVDVCAAAKNATLPELELRCCNATKWQDERHENGCACNELVQSQPIGDVLKVR